MNNIVSFYTEYRKHIGQYNDWQKGQSQTAVSSYPDVDTEKLKQKAKTIVDPILVLDNYEHEKAEDSESFFLTYNIELMSVASLLASLPYAVTKIIPFLNKHSDKSSIAKNLSGILSKYKNSSLNILKKNISLPKALSLVSLGLSALFYAKGIKNSMKSQLGLIRKASFDASQDIINDPKLFTLISDEQEKNINSELNFEQKTKSYFVDKLKERVDINSALKSVKDYNFTKNDYEKTKSQYFDSLKQNIPAKPTQNQENEAKSDKILMTSYIENVEHKVLEPLRRVETFANISYSSLFTGGFLEYLLTDKLVNVLKVKNKPLRAIMKLGVPLLTYFILNKNISNIENKAILATKYKALKNFAENPLEPQKDEDKKSLPEFLKTVYQDMKEYDKFAQNELPKLKEKLDIKKRIPYSKQQLAQAKSLQKNFSMAINVQREELYNKSLGIKALSETILGPLDIIATALGGKIGHSLSKKISNKKIAGIMTGLGAVIAFIPAAIVEAKLTKQQKLSEKIAAFSAIKELDDYKQFLSDADYNEFDFSNMPKIKSKVFKEFM